MDRLVRQLLVNDNNETNETLPALALEFPSNQRTFSRPIHWGFISLLALGLMAMVLIVIGGIWWWRHRMFRSRRRRQHSLPLTVTDFIDSTTTNEKRSAPSPIIVKAPPVPPRPTAYTTMLGSIEYRSNL